MKFHKTRLIVACLLLSSVSVSADGPGTSGGGDVLACRKGGFLGGIFKPRNWYFADSYRLISGGVVALTHHLPEGVYLRAILDTLKAKNKIVGEAVEKRIAELDFKAVKRVKKVNDDNIVAPQKCRKKQFAKQYISEKRVEYVARYRERILPAEFDLFKVHEALISLRGTEGDTSPIRKEVEALAADWNLYDFLAKSIYAARLVPRPYIDKVAIIGPAFWLIGQTLKLQPSMTYQTFISDPKYFRNMFESEENSVASSASFAGVKAAQAMMFGLMRGMLLITPNLNWIEMANIYESSPDVFRFSLKLAASGTRNEWVPIGSIEPERLRKDLQDILTHAPEIRPLEAQLREDLESSLALYEEMKKENASLPVTKAEAAFQNAVSEKNSSSAASPAAQELGEFGKWLAVKLENADPTDAQPGTRDDNDDESDDEDAITLKGEGSSG
jgi:hypothetical protein